ncbi:MAG: TonB-dependent receptor plug domain-containing protein [Gammaproteobacteria bacterium]
MNSGTYLLTKLSLVKKIHLTKLGYRVCLLTLGSCLILPASWATSRDGGGGGDSFLDLPLEDLLSVEVTSVSRKKQPLSEAAAAVFVISQEDIRRSGVTSIPEALRMAPGIQVARINAQTWAITSRGFNGLFANKLLVLIDGRSVYTPTYAGVYWDVQDTLLEDVERIEVIRGPGATLWGANAVNGVINIITRASADTQNGFIKLAAGNEEKAIAGFRYGAELGDQTQGRLYLKYADHDSFVVNNTEIDAGDDWTSAQAGFRLDGQLSAQHSWTLQGDVYQNDENQRVAILWLDPATNPPPYQENNMPSQADASGWNLLGRWSHQSSAESSMSLQLYLDHTERNQIYLTQVYDIVDIDFQHQLKLGTSNELIWGLGMRRIDDEFDNSFAVSINPDHQSNTVYSAFIQDEISLDPDILSLILGSKFEHNDYTGSEVQPSVRALWLPAQGHSTWVAVSRAVRTPSRIEDDGRIVTVIIPPTPTVVSLEGINAFESEELLAYELGYRLQASSNLSWDLAAFYNDYKNLQSYESGEFGNKVQASTHGIELALDWRPIEWWRLQTSYSYINISAQIDADSTDTISVQLQENNVPDQQLSLRSTMDISQRWKLDVWAYYVDELPVTSISALQSSQLVEDYTSLNIRLAWEPVSNLEISLVGQNLLDATHLEFIGESFIPQTLVERSVYGQLRLKF